MNQPYDNDKKQDTKSVNALPSNKRPARAKILKIFGWHFGRNDDIINSF